MNVSNQPTPSEPQKKPKKTQQLDDIPEGGFNDIMKYIGGIIAKYSRWRLYKLFRIVPNRIAFGFWGHLIGNLVPKIAGQIHHNDIKSLQTMFPQKSMKEIRLISKKGWIMMGFAVFYKMLVEMPNWTAQNLDEYLEIKGLEHLDNALKRGKGVIIASTHFGIIPSMYYALALKGYKTNLNANVRVSGPLVAINPIKGIRCIPTGSMTGESGMKSKLERVLKENQVLFIFADFSQRKQLGIQFMGRLGHTPASIPSLAKDTGAAIIPAFTYAHSLKKQVIQIMPEYKLVERTNMTKKEFLGYNMLMLNNMQTWLIRLAPEAYFERISYAMLKTYQRKLNVDKVNSKELALKAVDLANQVVESTYEYGRDEPSYYKILTQMDHDLRQIPDHEISNKIFQGLFKIEDQTVRDSLIQLFMKIKNMAMDPAVEKVLNTGLQQFVVLPYVGRRPKLI